MATIETALDSLRHRGPDDQGVYFSRDAVLAQRRLSIIDVSGGHQPIPNEDETLWIICNGEIYNYRELRTELQGRGHRFRTESDTEVILHLFEDDGKQCVDRLRGMFAFAIWNKVKRQLFVARDRLGQKPLYYVHRGEQIMFASEIKGLLALDDSLAELDVAALDQYLSLRILAAPRSMFRQIRKLPPAHRLEFSMENSEMHIERYWNPTYEAKFSGTEEDLIDELESRLLGCLQAHMVSDVPVGAFMSGGLDSTLIVAMLMKRVVDTPLKTFSMGLPYRDYDEAPYARMVAEQYGTEHHEEVVTPSLFGTLPQLIRHLDEPSDPLSLCTYLIAQQASRHVKVVIGGDGGDELFGGYDRYYGNRYADVYARIPRSLRRLLIGPLLKALPDGNWYKSPFHQMKWLHQLSFEQGGTRYANGLGYFYFRDEYRQKLYGAAMQVDGAFDPNAEIREMFEAAPAKDLVDRMLYADSQVRLPDHSVMILDRMTMAHGLEARSPFMDHELVEFVAKLPARLKVRGRTLRFAQAKLAERYLPPEILQRPKQGFSVALPYLLRNEYAMLFDQFLQRSSLAESEYLQQSAIDELLLEHRAGRVDHGNRLWLLLNAEVWFRMYLGRRSVDDMSAQLSEAAAEMAGHAT